LVFLDEFGAATNMTRTRARGPRGQRVVFKNPHGHYKSLSTIVAMSVQGILTGCVYDGGVGTAAFTAFVEQCLIQELRPGQVLVMDNLAAHKADEVRRLVESVGARVLFLPPYSPDFNPIENAISKIKQLLRKLGRRTVPDLIAAIGKAGRSITPEDVMGFMRHCGYAAICE
jgi:transposase